MSQSDLFLSYPHIISFIPLRSPNYTCRFKPEQRASRTVVSFEFFSETVGTLG